MFKSAIIAAFVAVGVSAMNLLPRVNSLIPVQRGTGYKTAQKPYSSGAKSASSYARERKYGYGAKSSDEKSASSFAKET